VSGTKGVFITTPANNKSPKNNYAGSLIWQEDGVVYTVSGCLTLDQALKTAASMKVVAE